MKPSRAAALLLVLACACSGSQRQTTIQTTFEAVNAARATFLAYERQHEHELAQRPDFEARLAEWQAKRETINNEFTAAYTTLAAAARLNSDPSLNAALQAAALLSQALAAIGVKP